MQIIDIGIYFFFVLPLNAKEVSASLPAVQKSMTDMDINEHQKKPSKEQSQLQFGFSTELENLVNQLMQENKDV